MPDPVRMLAIACRNGNQHIALGNPDGSIADIAIISNSFLSDGMFEIQEEDVPDIKLIFHAFNREFPLAEVRSVRLDDTPRALVHFLKRLIGNPIETEATLSSDQNT